MPGADLSEQISTAGTEASGTGNMKLALNGALTIGTDDGANIEIRQNVGDDNIFIFGLHDRTRSPRCAQRGYQPMRCYESNPQLKAVLDAIAGGAFSPDEPARYRGLVDCAAVGRRPLPAAGRLRRLRRRAGARRRAVPRAATPGRARRSPTSPAWASFSSDRTIREYATQIWSIEPQRLTPAAAGHRHRPACSTTHDIDLICQRPPRRPVRRAGPACTTPTAALWLRAFLPGAAQVAVVDAGSGAALARAAAARTPTACSKARCPAARRRLPAAGALGRRQQSLLDDPYRFGAGARRDWTSGCWAKARTCGPSRCWARTPREMDGVAGTSFAVWAPNASRVSVVGDFNLWDGRRHPMRLRRECGVWEIFLPGVAAGARYKFELLRPRRPAAAAEGRPVRAPGRAAPGHRQRRGAACRRWRRARPQRQARQRAGRADEHLRGAPGLVAAQARGRQPLARPGTSWPTTLVPYAARHGLHPPRAAAGQRAPVRRLLGLPAARPVRADRALRRRRRASAASSSAATPQAWACCSTGCRRTSRPTRTAWRDFDGTHLYEYADPREGFHHDWNTLIYNFGRTEVRNFLVGNALYWLERYDVDGLRVDAVASMLYRDYSRKAGEWVPNVHGGRENLEAIAFLKRMNEVVGVRAAAGGDAGRGIDRLPGGVAPDLRRRPGLPLQVEHGLDARHAGATWRATRSTASYHHDEMTFGLVYAFNENFVLPLSHDEVVHGKGSLLGKMPGDRWQQFANLRAYYGFMFGHPGKKLLFMGGEFAQEREWNHDQQPRLAPARTTRCTPACSALVRDLNRLYRATPALHQQRLRRPTASSGSTTTTRAHSVLSFVRRGRDGDDADAWWSATSRRWCTTATASACRAAGALARAAEHRLGALRRQQRRHAARRGRHARPCRAHGRAAFARARPAAAGHGHVSNGRA